MPDFINWKEIGSTKKERFCMATFTWVIAFCLMVGAIFSMVRFKAFASKMASEFKQSTGSCPDGISQKIAYQNYADGDTSLLGCYCKSEFETQGESANQISFLEFNSALTEKDQYLCKDWKFSQTLQEMLILGSSMITVGINVTVIVIMEFMSKLERKHYLNLQTKSQFVKILIMQFLNIVVISLLVNMNVLRSSPFPDTLPILKGKYEDFSP